MLKFLDITNYLAPGFSYSQYLKAKAYECTSSSRTSGWRPWTNWTSASCHLTKPFSVPWRMRTSRPKTTSCAWTCDKRTTWRPWTISLCGIITKTSNPCWKPSTRCFSLTRTDVLICLKTASAFPDSSWSTCAAQYRSRPQEDITMSADAPECNPCCI